MTFEERKLVAVMAHVDVLTDTLSGLIERMPVIAGNYEAVKFAREAMSEKIRPSIENMKRVLAETES